MMKKALLMGLMLVLGALPITKVGAIHDENCEFPDTFHYYSSGGGFTIWESKKDDLVILGFGYASTADGCIPADPVNGPTTDYDYETGIGGARLQVFDGGACGPWIGHHTTTYYVSDDSTGDLVSSSAGADGTSPEAPCGDGIVDGSGQADCLAHFWGKGPHEACGVGADGSYWIFIDTVIGDLNEPRLGAATTGCVWTTNNYAPEDACHGAWLTNSWCTATSSTKTLAGVPKTTHVPKCGGATCQPAVKIVPSPPLWEIICYGNPCDGQAPRARTSVKLIEGGIAPDGIAAWVRAESWCGNALLSSREVTWPDKSDVDLLGPDKYPPENKTCVFKFRHVLDANGDYTAEAECS